MKLIYELNGNLAALTEQGLVVVRNHCDNDGVWNATYIDNDGSWWEYPTGSPESTIEQYLDSGYVPRDHRKITKAYGCIQNCKVIDDKGEELVLKCNKLHYKGETYSFNFRPEGMFGVDSKCPSYLTEYVITDSPYGETISNIKKR